MELMLIVYGVAVVVKLSKLLGIVFLTLVVVSLVLWARWATTYSVQDGESAMRSAQKHMYWKTCLGLLLSIAIIPSERTLQYMAGAYLIQSVYESTEAREVGNATKKVVMSQLEVWSKGNEQLITLIEQIKPVVQGKVHDYSTTGAQQ